jgi:hypothetical protein
MKAIKVDDHSRFPTIENIENMVEDERRDFEIKLQRRLLSQFGCTTADHAVYVTNKIVSLLIFENKRKTS